VIVCTNKINYAKIKARHKYWFAAHIFADEELHLWDMFTKDMEKGRLRWEERAKALNEQAKSLLKKLNVEDVR
jgi:hypothetical protein